jgi:hypothetical protein
LAPQAAGGPGAKQPPNGVLQEALQFAIFNLQFSIFNLQRRHAPALVARERKREEAPEQQK